MCLKLSVLFEELGPIWQVINISALVSPCVFDTELHHEFINYLSKFLQIYFYEDFTQLLLSPNKCEQIKTPKIFLGISMKTGHCSKQMWSHDRIDICSCRCVYTCLSLHTACFAQMLGVVDAHSPTLGLTEGHFEICKEWWVEGGSCLFAVWVRSSSAIFWEPQRRPKSQTHLQMGLWLAQKSQPFWEQV